jgi:hypothetical protein
MRIRRLGWIGTRTEAAVQTVSFFNDVLGLEMEKRDEDFLVVVCPKVELWRCSGPPLRTTATSQPDP